MEITIDKGGPVSGEEGPVRHQIDVAALTSSGVYDTPAAIAWYRLETIIDYAVMRGRGIHMTDPRKARSVQLSALRANFGIAARRWEQAAAELRNLSDDWAENGVPDEFLIRR